MRAVRPVAGTAILMILLSKEFDRNELRDEDEVNMHNIKSSENPFSCALIYFVRTETIEWVGAAQGYEGT
jgi:hypothetical protein